MTAVTFTQFVSTQPLSKRFSLDDRGGIAKAAMGRMTEGTAELVTCAFEDFPAHLAAADAKTAFAYGGFRAGQHGNPVPIVTTARQPSEPGAIARNGDFFHYPAAPGILMLDHDPHPRGPSLPEGAASLLDALAKILPEIDEAAAIGRGSISAGVHRRGFPPSAGGGVRLYLPVQNASDIPRCGAVLVKRLWLAGSGYIAFARNGAMLPRTLIDAAVFSPERLDFVGAPILGPGLAWTPPKITLNWEGGCLDTRALADLSPAEEEHYQAAVADARDRARPESERMRGEWVEARIRALVGRGVAESEARRHIEAIRHDRPTMDLPPVFRLKFARADLGIVSVGAVLADPAQFNGQALADPIEGPDYGATTAKFYANNDGKPCIHSFAHGGGLRYFLKGGISEMFDDESAPAGGKVALIRGSAVQPQPIEWLWPGFLARGKLHILAGPPGTGKTMLLLGLAATVTAGGRWPDGSGAEPANVLIWSGEDSIDDTLTPRLLAAGADMRRVYFVDQVADDNGPRLFDPARDMEHLARTAAGVGNVGLVIVDPVVTAVSGDSHKNAETRRGLQPLVDLGQRLGAAVVGLTHFSKGTSGRDPLERVSGSLAFGAVARIVMVAAKLPDTEGGGRLFARAKSNIGPDGGGFRYEVEDAPVRGYPGLSAYRVRWGEAVNGAARELLGEADDDAGASGGALGEAVAFLRELLSDGPKPHKSIKADAAAAGISWRTIERAKKKVHALAKRDGANGWVWRLPGTDAGDFDDLSMSGDEAL